MASSEASAADTWRSRIAGQPVGEFQLAERRADGLLAAYIGAVARAGNLHSFVLLRLHLGVANVDGHAPIWLGVEPLGPAHAVVRRSLE